MPGPSSEQMATQTPQSLPSFAQTFGGPASLNRLSEMNNNSLPPIQNRSATSFERNRKSPRPVSPQPPTPLETKHNNRKRLHQETSGVQHDDDNSITDNGRKSPKSVRIKQESEYDTMPINAPSLTRPPPLPTQPPLDSGTSSPSVNSPVPTKKRRVTISGMAQPINTDVRRPSVDSGISPVVMGFTIMRDDPAALEQVRSMITVKQKQKALIEQRRGSTAGIVAPTAPPSVNIVNPRQGSEEYQGPPPKPPGRGGGRSPNNASNQPRRSVVAASNAPPPPTQAATSHPRQPSPSTLIVPSQQSMQSNVSLTSQPEQAPTQTHLHPSAAVAAVPPTPSLVPPVPPNALPPPPISFARRRAGRQLGSAKKPADIVISPRDRQSEGLLQPSIQSAPPIPRAGQAQSFSMTLPSLPPALAPGQSTKRLVSGQVPPTPTRLAMRHSTAGPSGLPGRSPPASVPIATTLVPPTPSSLHHPSYSSEKSAFLAPFETFYDALNDSKQLKNWLGEQLLKSNTLMHSLQRQQEQMEETISSLVDKKVSAMREEIYGLRVRVDELEHALRQARTSAPSGYSPNMSHTKSKGKANGYTSISAQGVVSESYTFPPVESIRRPDGLRRVSSPDPSEPRSGPGSTTASPVPFELGRRLSVSAMRLDPPPARSSDVSASGRPSFSSQRERERERDREPYPHRHLMGGWSPHTSKASLPTSSTRSSLSMNTDRERERMIDPLRPGPSRSSGSHHQSHVVVERERDRYPQAYSRERQADRDVDMNPSRHDREKVEKEERDKRSSGGSDFNHPASSQQERERPPPPPAASSRRASVSPSTSKGRPMSPMDES
ncbi:hypothetical protein C8Q75DRAFT_807941 [Abortiporus biennis]|nr:hypothetical protein C8Q75DRAFT_807941 [Abortiporus biennis]